jgi:D-alanyl-D-alanine carboxypeptidase/D-alanyl-D-alanine-endopeptidase (penicillin-binding protein 4)
MVMRRASNPLRVVIAAGVVGTVLLAILMVWLGNIASRSEALATKEPIAPVSVSVLSVRRHPDVLSRTTRLNTVQSGMDAFVSDLPSGSCTSMTWLNKTLTATNMNATLVPGSLVKVLTAVASMEILGPDFRFVTEVRGSIVNGVVADLFIVGGGDPVLVRSNYPTTEKYPTLYGTTLDTLADSVVASGVRQILGAVVGVESRYDTARFVSVWPETFNGVEAGPLGALMSSDAMVGSTGMRANEPANGAALDFSSLLAARGVSVTGSTRVGQLPDGLTVLATIESAPLSEIVKELLINSDNNTGELLLKEMGFKEKGEGSTAAGITVVQEFLKREYSDHTALLSDGSGLSAQNGFTCSFVMDVLSDHEEWLLPSLPIAGESGTLRDMFRTSPIAGIMRAKTGTLSNVKGLAGYVPVEGDDSVQFVLMMNAPSVDQQSVFMPHWNDLAEVTALASSSPSASELAP